MCCNNLSHNREKQYLSSRLSLFSPNSRFTLYVYVTIVHDLQWNNCVLLNNIGSEEEALQCFRIAAALGNHFAKQQTISLNPYAAMCNKMLAEVFETLKKNWSTGIDATCIFGVHVLVEFVFSCYINHVRIKQIADVVVFMCIVLYWMRLSESWVCELKTNTQNNNNHNNKQITPTTTAK